MRTHTCSLFICIRKYSSLALDSKWRRKNKFKFGKEKRMAADVITFASLTAKWSSNKKWNGWPFYRSVWSSFCERTSVKRTIDGARARSFHLWLLFSSSFVWVRFSYACRRLIAMIVRYHSNHTISKLFFLFSFACLSGSIGSMGFMMPYLGYILLSCVDSLSPQRPSVDHDHDHVDGDNNNNRCLIESIDLSTLSISISNRNVNKVEKAKKACDAFLSHN